MEGQLRCGRNRRPVGSDSRVRADLVAVRDTTLGLQRPVHDVRTDVEQGGCVRRIVCQPRVATSGTQQLRTPRRTFLLLLVQVVVECVVTAIGAVVQRETVGRLVVSVLAARTRSPSLLSPPSVRLWDVVDIGRDAGHLWGVALLPCPPESAQGEGGVSGVDAQAARFLASTHQQSGSSTPLSKVSL